MNRPEQPEGSRAGGAPRGAVGPTMARRIARSAGRVLGAVAVVVVAAWVVVAQPSCARHPRSAATVRARDLRDRVEALCGRYSPRDWQHREQLEACAAYIAAQFAEAGAAVEFQPVMVGRKAYRNVIGRFGAGQRPRIILGAHYDTCGEQPGADDNASGVAVLVEVARLLGRSPTPQPVDVVAYVLEEPPFFRTDQMGSAVHAKRLAADRAGCRGVIVLEMVGYFSEAWGSQGYPLPLFHLMYPSRGNFIGVIGRWDQGDWVRAVKAGMKGATDLPVYSIRAPPEVPGVDFSDHLNYWAEGFKAVMVTDTAFYRNKAYHSAGDRPERLDYERMAQVAVGVYEAIVSL